MLMSTGLADSELFAAAREYTGINDEFELIREALRSLVAREASRRLAAMGGSDPEATAAPRRRHG